MDQAQRTDLIAQLRGEGFDVTEWRDDPGTVYPLHLHRAREARIVLEGSMSVTVGDQTRDLGPGDRIDFAPDEPHSARVGPDGVRYLAGTER